MPLLCIVKDTNGKWNKVSDVATEGSVLDYFKLEDLNGDGKKVLFIDSALGAHSMFTEIVAYNNGKLIKVGNENDGILFKAYPLYSKDIKEKTDIPADNFHLE